MVCLILVNQKIFTNPRNSWYEAILDYLLREICRARLLWFTLIWHLPVVGLLAVGSTSRVILLVRSTGTRKASSTSSTSSTRILVLEVEPPIKGPGYSRICAGVAREIKNAIPTYILDSQHTLLWFDWHCSKCQKNKPNSRFLLPVHAWKTTFDPQHRPFLAKKKSWSLRRRRSQQLHGLQWTYSPPYSWWKIKALLGMMRLPNKNSDPKKNPCLSCKKT